jgi:predicted nucleotidyltransferase/uncharacterized protein (UPF0332 family)
MATISSQKFKQALGKNLLAVVKGKEEYICIYNNKTSLMKIDDIKNLQKKLPKRSRLVLLSELWDEISAGKDKLIKDLLTGKKIYDNNFISRLKYIDEFVKATTGKFDKYIFSIVLFGSTARGQAKKESDLDIAVIIDDTDLRNMTRNEAREKLLGIMSSTALGIFSKFNIQAYLLTQFWEYVREANPVIFTLLRDGIPFHDKGLFSPWRVLLREGKIKPTAEAIDNMLLSGSVFVKRINQTISKTITEDLYYAMLNPAQSALMLYGIPPMTPNETPILLEKVFVSKKMIESKYVRWLEDILKLRKGLESGKMKLSEFNAEMLNEQSLRAEEFIKRMTSLFEQIRDSNFSEDIDKMEYVMSQGISKAFEASDSKIPKKAVYERFKEKFIDTGLLNRDEWETVKYIKNIRSQFESKKLTKQEISLAKDMLEDFIKDVDFYVKHPETKKTKRITAHVRFRHKEGVGDLWVIEKIVFIVQNIKHPEIRILKGRLVGKGKIDAVSNTSFDSFMKLKSVAEASGEQHIADDTIESLKRMFEDVEIILK